MILRRSRAQASATQNQINLKDCKVHLKRLNLPKVNQRSKQSGENKTHTVQESAPALNLRSRKHIKYAESSLEISKSGETPKSTKKVPVYKRQEKIREKPIKRKQDLYEFDSDSEKRKKQKKLSDSSLDEDVLIIKKKLKNNTKKKNKKVISANKKTDVEKKKGKPNALETQQTNNNYPRLNLINKKNIPTKIKITNVAQSELINREKGFEERETGRLITKRIKQTKDENNKDNNANTENKNIIVNNNDCFGFLNSPAVVRSPKVTIISDVRLTPREEFNGSIASPRWFRDGKPNANSTMLNNVLTPWRFNEINVQRNPHFLILKESSLPCINQEMILDHTIMDKLNGTTNIEIPNMTVEKKGKSPKKTQVQAKINEYFNSNVENKENDEINQSLFDNDQFSPIKTRNRASSKSERVKRKILGEINDNAREIQVSSTPVKRSEPASLKHIERKNEELDFGFSSGDDSVQENLPVKEKNDRPFRLSVNVNDRKYNRKRRVRIQSPKSVVDSDESSDASDVSDAETENREVRIFEDFNLSREHVEESKTVSKKKKRKKQKDVRNVRTKEEEEEAEKWAAAFNSMCEEVEDFPLEIE